MYFSSVAARRAAMSLEPVPGQRGAWGPKRAVRRGVRMAMAILEGRLVGGRLVGTRGRVDGLMARR